MQRQLGQPRRDGRWGMGSTEPHAKAYWVGTAGECCIQRDGLGRFLVQRCDQPHEQWVAANLPSAHALCQQMVNASGR